MGGRPSAVRTPSRTPLRVRSQSGPPRVIRSGVISQVSRTLVSARVCSPRPKRACRACAISFLVTGARNGRGSTPTPSTSIRSARADISMRVLKSPHRSEASSSFASCFRAPCPMVFRSPGRQRAIPSVPETLALLEVPVLRWQNGLDIRGTRAGSGKARDRWGVQRGDQGGGSVPCGDRPQPDLRRYPIPVPTRGDVVRRAL